MAKRRKYSFEQLCLDNDRIDILNRWDYDLNDYLPSEISAKSEKKFWFKCPRGIHESELHVINSLTYGKARDIHCIKCDSFAQHCIDEYGFDYFNYIWSDKNTKSPWEISYGSSNKVLLNDDNYKDGIHMISADHFFRKKTDYILPDDSNVTQGKSLGDFHPECISTWSDKNEKTPFDYYTSSNAEVWWKCPNGIHEDFLRRVDSSKARGFTCPICGRLGVGLIDLTGQRFGELTVTGFDKSVDGVPFWWCDCSCGNHVSVRGISLRKGNTKTCGDRVAHYSGENNPNWKGNEKTDNQRIRSSKPYKRWRDAIIDKYGSVCLITSQYTNNPNLHHIYPMSDYPELMFEEWNVVVIDENLHNMYIPDAFHYVYGAKHNTPEQLELYVNEQRKKLGINNPFDINEYIEKRKIEAANSSIKKPIIDLKEE